MALTPVGNIMINPDHISTIDVHQDYNDSAYCVYTITMYNGTTHEIRLRDYYNGPDYPWSTLYRSYPKLYDLSL